MLNPGVPRWSRCHQPIARLILEAAGTRPDMQATFGQPMAPPAVDALHIRLRARASEDALRSTQNVRYWDRE